MSNNLTETLCPCESGYRYSQCCGEAGRTQPNIVASITSASQDEITALPLPTELEEALDHINTNPSLFPARINFPGSEAYFFKMTPQLYRDSVFMDPGRIHGSCIIKTDLDWLSGVCSKIHETSSAYIFHTAFCGSTLMSQSLDAVYHTLPIREPELLGNLLVLLRNPDTSSQNKNDWYKNVLALLSRRFNNQDMAVIKANDYANPVMLEMIQQKTDIPILFMYTSLPEFLAGCLKADNRKQWIEQRFNSLRLPITQLLGLDKDFRVASNAYGELAALYWSYNILLYQKAHRKSPSAIRSLEFSNMLDDPVFAVRRCGEWFGLQVKEDVDFNRELEPLMGTYSKNKKFSYSAEQRQEDIMRLLDSHQAELASAEALASELLKDDYPQTGLSGSLLA